MSATDGYRIRRVGRRYYAEFLLDADDCDNVAGFMGSDGWATELFAAAEELRRLVPEDEE